MGATIHYRKAAGGGDPYLHKVGAPSSFMDAMERAFGHWPCTVGAGDVPVLRGMKAACVGTGEEYGEIIDLIEQLGSIELYAAW